MTVRDCATSRRGWQDREGARKWELPSCHDLRALSPQEATPLSALVPRLPRSVKDRLLRHLRLCRAPGLKTRYLILVNLAAGRSPPHTAAVLALHRATVYRVAARFRDRGE